VGWLHVRVVTGSQKALAEKTALLLLLPLAAPAATKTAAVVVVVVVVAVSCIWTGALEELSQNWRCKKGRKREPSKQEEHKASVFIPYIDGFLMR